MSIAHDLSSEIAIALLTGKEQKGNLKELQEVVLRVHDVLLSEQACCERQSSSISRDRVLASRLDKRSGRTSWFHRRKSWWWLIRLARTCDLWFSRAEILGSAISSLREAISQLITLCLWRFVFDSILFFSPNEFRLRTKLVFNTNYRIDVRRCVNASSCQGDHMSSHDEIWSASAPRWNAIRMVNESAIWHGIVKKESWIRTFSGGAVDLRACRSIQSKGLTICTEGCI